MSLLVVMNLSIITTSQSLLNAQEYDGEIAAIHNPHLWPKPQNPIPGQLSDNRNIQTLQKYYNAYAENNIEGMRSVMAENVEWHIPGHHPLAGTKHGIQEVVNFFQQLPKAGFKAEVLILAANDDYVIDAHRGWGSYRGKSIDINWILLYQFDKNGKICRVQNFSADQYASDAFFYYVYGNGLGKSSSEDREKIIAIVNDIGTLADQCDWNRLAQMFADAVLLDYTSMVGGKPETLSPQEIMVRWKSILPGFDMTQHKITDHKVELHHNQADVYSKVMALHYIAGSLGGEIWIVQGEYYHHLIQTKDGWKVNKMKFIVGEIRGNNDLPGLAIRRVASHSQPTWVAGKNLVGFISEGLTLKGHLYLPDNYQEGKRYPAIVIIGSWTTVKEQMAGTYAQKLAHNGWLTFAFDPRFYGESQGQPRFYESPLEKIKDIKNAITYLQSLSIVDGNNIGLVGICAGAGYVCGVAAEDDRVKVLATVASWFQDRKAVEMIYGGKESVENKIKAAREAKEHYHTSGEVEYIPTISKTNPNAAMYGDFDYYLNPKRGATTEWSADKFAVMSWEDWLNFNPMPFATKIKVPILMIHSDNAALPEYTKQFFADIPGNQKKLYWFKGNQFDFYDREEQVTESLKQICEYFRSILH